MEKTVKQKKCKLYWLFLFIMMATGAYFIALSTILSSSDSHWGFIVCVILCILITFSNHYAYLIGAGQFKAKFLNLLIVLSLNIITFRIVIFLMCNNLKIDGIELDMFVLRCVLCLSIGNSILGYIAGRIDMENLELSEN